jgi:type IV secretion system protein VirB6
VVGGGITLELLVPVVAALGNGVEGASGRGALGLFLVASIHLALMMMVTRVAGTMVAGWQVFGLAGSSEEETRVATDSAPAPQPEPLSQYSSLSAAPMSGSRAILTGSAMTAAATDPLQWPAANSPQGSGRTAAIRQIETTTVHTMPPRQQHRARGVGSRFRSPTRMTREMIR